jgi:mannitol/fructose-specific phosphotransferase system IIA component (Ntr-type)
MVLAAVVAFAASANAGLLAASRYPLAMARDHLFPHWLARTGARGAPVGAVLFTGGVLAVVLATLDVAQVAKLAGALQLVLFALVNVAVIVMRESHIEAYDPGFRSPLYPWMQLAGLFVPLVLVAEMGWMPVLFTIAVTAVCVAWYRYYAEPRIARDGAIFHVFERLGRRRYAGLDRELRDLMKEKGLRDADPFDEVVAGAAVLEYPGTTRVGRAVADASAILARRLPVSAEALEAALARGMAAGGAPVSHGAALLHTRLSEMDVSELVLVRCAGGAGLEGLGEDEEGRHAPSAPIRAVFVLVSGEADPGRHLRILAQLAGRVEQPSFLEAWNGARDEQELKETLLRDDRFLSVKVQAGTPAEPLIGRALNETDLPPGCLIALIRRYGEMIVPQGRTVLREGDRLTIIGTPAGLSQVAARYAAPHPIADTETGRRGL